MTPNLQHMILQFFSQIPEDIFDTRLKEIGVELKIAGMQSSQKPQTILDKINAYIDEYENVGEGEGEGEEEIPEA